MKKIYILGMGRGKAYLDRCLLRENVKIVGFIDNYRADEVTEFHEIPVIKQDRIADVYDYIVITLKQYEGVRDGLLSQGVERNKVISFFAWSDANQEIYWEILDPYKWRMELIWQHYMEIVLPAMDNLNYEIYSHTPVVKKSCPRIMDAEHTVELLYDKKKCLARFGDGEFEIMCGRKRAVFQDTEVELGKRLKEVLCADLDNLLVAIADNYGSLEQYTDEAAGDIRAYLTKEVRRDHMKLLDLDRQYYDAYLSRPYMIYRDKAGAADRFKRIKKIWEKEDVLIVEGEYTRFGVGNDLLEEALSVTRILAPGKNAFSRYKEILDKVLEYGKGKLILAVLGPTATVLAYDLAKQGYHIIDIGQLDMEYEWYLRGVEKRCAIPHKYVSEVPQYGSMAEGGNDAYRRKYESEIIARIL